MSLQDTIDMNRSELVGTLQELTYVLNPKVQANYALQDLSYQAKKVYFQAMTTLDEARDGDLDAKRKVAAAAGIAVGVVGLLALRRKRK